MSIIGLFSTPAYAAPTPEQSLSSKEIIEQLKGGGYVLYFRHASTIHSQLDKDISDLSDCSQQRNLSEKGIEQAKVIGQSINALQIPIDKVFTSPYCRCVDTAKLAFEKYKIADDLKAAFILDQIETKALAKALTVKLSTRTKQGSNTVLISHTANLREATRIWPKPEGVLHVFKPLGREIGYHHVGSIKPNEWKQFQ